MKLISKYKYEIAIIIIVSVIYFLVRLPNLTLQPIFADEAIYVRWAQVMRAEPTLRFLPLSDGKTPLFMWFMIPLFKIFEDPLFAGRFLSVSSGFITMLGVLFLGWKFFNKRVSLWSAFLIAITPFIFFFDRMALVDSMMSAFAIWSLNLALLLIKYQRVDLAMFLGYALGGGLLTKTPAFFNILTLPLTLIIFPWKHQNRQSKILKIFGLWVLAIFTALIIYNILRLGPGFYNLTSRNQDYVRSPMTLIERPWDPILPHSRDLAGILPSYLGYPIILVLFYSFYLVIKKKHLVGITILLWGLFPIIAQLALLRVFTARYILFSIPPLMVIAAYGIDQILARRILKKLLLKIGLMLLIAAWPLYFSFNLLTDPIKTPLFKNERKGYLEDWTAGYGFKEIASYFDDLSKKELIVVGTEGFFGTLPDGLQIYLDRNRQVVIIGQRATVSAELRQTAKEHPTFFVTNKSRFPYLPENLELIREYKKVKAANGSQDAILVFKVYPEVSPSAKLSN